jgi:hypothetical protein
MGCDRHKILEGLQGGYGGVHEAPQRVAADGKSFRFHVGYRWAGIYLIRTSQLSVQPHHSRKALLVASIQQDVREMVVAVQFYKEHRVQMQEQVTAILEAGRVVSQQAPTLEDVEALGFSIFGHGSIARPEIGEMAVRALRAQCSDVPHHVKVSCLELYRFFIVF